MSVSIFYPTSASVYTRIVDNTGLTELHIDVDIAQDFIFVLTGSFPNTSSIVFIQGMDTGSVYPISSSWSFNTVTSSITTTASYALTASFALNAAGVNSLNATTPTYKILATASVPYSSGSFSDVLCFTSFTSSNARADGADIRIQADGGGGTVSGSYLPISVVVGAITGSSVTYIVNWTDTFISSSVKNYVITYGDPGARYMYLTQDQNAMQRKRSNVSGNVVVYNDNNQADSFTDANWGTLGTRIAALTNDDDTWGTITPTGGYWYNGQYQTIFSISPNGFFKPANSQPAGYSLVAPDEWAINNADDYQLWCDLCYSSDGWFLQYYHKRGFGGGTPYMKAVVRYRNNGKFILSVFNTTPDYQALIGTMTFSGYTGTNKYWAYSFSNPTGSNPSTAVAMVIEPCATAGISSGQLPYP